MQLFQYFALGRVVQVYFWGESEILLFIPARVFSVDNFNIRALCSGVLQCRPPSAASIMFSLCM